MLFFYLSPKVHTPNLIIETLLTSFIYMKTMTCRELGGPCDEELSASTWDDMVSTMTDHVMENHPETANEMERMHEEDPEMWGRKMKPKWEAKPESGEDTRAI